MSEELDLANAFEHLIKMGIHNPYHEHKKTTMPEIQKLPVQSSNIEAIGYDYNQARISSPPEATMRVWFKNGAYDYDKVPMPVFEEFKKSHSIGSYFATNIKGKYPCIKVNG